MKKKTLIVILIIVIFIGLNAAFDNYVDKHYKTTVTLEGEG
jgi:hypothetical protein